MKWLEPIWICFKTAPEKSVSQLTTLGRYHIFIEEYDIFFIMTIEFIDMQTRIRILTRLILFVIAI
jgi:hypothetical protein